MPNEKDLFDELRKQGVLKKKELIDAYDKVDRKKFIPKEFLEFSYINEPVQIGSNQTISQPYTVFFMLDALDLKKGQKVLDVGTGSGWAAALIAEIICATGRVITIERIKELYDFAKKRIKKYKNIKQVLGDGSKGYAREAPYDRIIVAATAPSIPKPLFKQLKEKGILIIITGNPPFDQIHKLRKKGLDQYEKILTKKGLWQNMLKITKINGKMKIENLGRFDFVPLIGKHGFKNENIS